MDIRKQAMDLIRKTDAETRGASLLQKASFFCWETGLGPVLNALPKLFGEQAVLNFPGRNGKFSLPCCESDGKILLAADDKELKTLSSLVLQNPGVEIWLKDGWYAGTVRILSPEEEEAAAGQISDEVFFGTAGNNMAGRSLKSSRLLEVTRNAPCTGISGPGSKAWVWALAAFLLLFSRKKK